MSESHSRSEKKKKMFNTIENDSKNATGLIRFNFYVFYEPSSRTYVENQRRWTQIRTVCFARPFHLSLRNSKG